MPGNSAIAPRRRGPDHGAGYDAVVLAGGRARRLGGLHKPALEVGGVPLVGRVAAAVHEADRLVVVGPPHRVPDRAVVTCEDPPGSGPVPALAAGLVHVRAAWVALLAADLPYLRQADIDLLRRRAGGRNGAVLLDAGGREQWLAGVWRVSALEAAVASYEETSLGGLLGPLSPALVAPGPSVGAAAPWLDCDTMGDLDMARMWTGG